MFLKIFQNFTPPPPPQFSLKPYKLNAYRKGFSLIEIITAIGIGAVISGIATISYLSYYKKAQWNKIYQTGLNFKEALQICLTKYWDNPELCADLTKLKLQCDYCVPDGGKDVRKKQSSLGGFNFRIQMEVGEYRGTAIVREDALPRLVVRIQNKVGVTPLLKFCAHKHTALDGTPDIATTDHSGNPIPPADQRQGGSVKPPFRVCTNNSDCETGEQCFDARLPHWNNASWGN